MPLAVRRGGGGGGGGGVQQKALVSQLLADHSGTEESREEVKQDVEPRIDQSDLWLVKYDELALKTHNIPLSHLSCCRYEESYFILQVIYLLLIDIVIIHTEGSFFLQKYLSGIYEKLNI